MNYLAVPSDVDHSFSRSRETLASNNVLGWYLYSFSSEPFIVSAVSTYVPLLLEQFARINGVSLHDHTRRCSPSDDKCVLGLFDNLVFIDTSSFALYTFSLSVLCQTLIVISVSGIVDMCNTVKFKSNVLLFFGLLGSVSTILISQLNSSQYYSLAFWSIVANCCYGVVNVVGNSLLPVFVPDMIAHHPAYRDWDVDNLTTIISGRGSSVGYVSALLVQIFSVVLVKKSRSQDNIQVAVLLVGCWWLLWQMPMSWLLQDVSLPAATSTQFRWSRSAKYARYGWASLGDALKHASLLKDVVIFLVGWFIISDSITTINSTAILFSKTELKMNTVDLIFVSILTMVNAILGAFSIPQLLSSRLRQPPQRTLVYIICWASVIPLYGILGFFFSSIGLKHKFEMYMLAVWYGVALGGLSAVSRSVFSLIIPRGKESIFFSLFSVTDKGSSILGPFLIGLITDKTHNIRYSFYLLFVLLVLSLPVFSALDVARGKREAQELSELNATSQEQS